MTDSAASFPILSRIVVVDEIPSAGLPLTITTTEAERAALAVFNHLVAVRAMTAAVILRHEARGGVHLTGEVSADVTQSCVVSLEAFDATVREPIDIHFMSHEMLEVHREARRKRPARPDDEETEDDEPDLIEHGRIDVGAVAAEHLTLGLDPYPRKPGASLDPVSETGEPSASPFAVLRAPRDAKP